MRAYFMETNNIAFSRWTEKDLELALQLWGDRNVTRFICANGELSEPEIKSRLLLEVKNDKEFGIQYWPIFLRLSASFMGCCGLRPFNGEKNSYEIGIHLCEEYWGKGYAAESMNKVISYAYAGLGAERLFAGHHPENVKSGKLLEGIGFRYIGDKYYEPTGLHHPSYELAVNNVQISC